jgi:hypothetical protein
MMCIQTTLNHRYGSAHPIVARTVLQASRLMGQLGVADAVQQPVTAAFLEIQRHLLECEDRRELVCQPIARIDAALRARGPHLNNGVLQLDTVPDIQSHVDTFLLHAKAVLREAMPLFAAVGLPAVDERQGRKALDVRARELVDNGHFTADSPLVRFLIEHEAWVLPLMQKRNAIEHPGGRSGRLTVRNFRLEPGATGRPTIHPPDWFRNEEPPVFLQVDLPLHLQRLLEFVEILFAQLLQWYRRHTPLTIAEIPLAERDPDAPLRFRVTLVHP